MSERLEQTLILVKPDAVERGLMGKIIDRFETAGFKIIAMKMLKPSKELAEKHYDEDVAMRRGEAIRKYNIDFITSGPVVALVVEGIDAIDNVRKFCGDTEPKSALPGTIRGDYSHVSYAHCDKNQMVVKNVIHAAADPSFASQEISLWFEPSEITDYENVHEKHTR